MTFRRILLGFLGYALLVIAAVSALVLGLSVDPNRAPSGPYVVSAWRNGTRVARMVTASDPKRALEKEQAEPGTAIVTDRVVDEAPVLALNPALFALSVRPGRDGVLARYGGRVAYLTPDDLVVSHAYRAALGTGWLGFGVRIDPGTVVARLSRELACTPDELWARGDFRRFVSTHAVRNQPSRAKPRDAAVTPSDIATNALRAAEFLAARVDDEGRLVFRGTVASKDYDWALHARVTGALGRASTLLDNRALRATARRAARRLADATGRCGEHPCVGDGPRVETAASAEALRTFATLSGVVSAQAFLQQARSLGDFVKSQQRPTGGFASHFDRASRTPSDDSHARGADATAVAVSSLAAAYRVTGDRSDLAAAERGALTLVRAEQASVEANVSDVERAERCFALAEVARQGAAVAGGAESCRRWALGRAGLQLGDEAGDFRGGYPPSLFALPETGSTARIAQGLVAVARSALGSRHQDSATGRSLALEIAGALSFLSRRSLPGERSYLLADPNGLNGAFAKSPVDPNVRLDDVERAATAMLDYLAVAKERAPDRERQKRRPPPLAPAGFTPLPRATGDAPAGSSVGR